MEVIIALLSFGVLAALSFLLTRTYLTFKNERSAVHQTIANAYEYSFMGMSIGWVAVVISVALFLYGCVSDDTVKTIRASISISNVAIAALSIFATLAFHQVNTSDQESENEVEKKELLATFIVGFVMVAVTIIYSLVMMKMNYNKNEKVKKLMKLRQELDM